ncbi:uncharacterized protein LOC135961947 [Calliphora vicina]|uniref:uncharacterized protein LOC135961947 n=1 Tax=Calliphora vicina TaxID=7373 RepID=UPI00325ADACF
MKCCSRSTVGVIIGSIYMLAGIIVFILISISLVLSKTKDDNVRPIVKPDVAIIMILCLTAALISGLLVFGIVKRRHNLLLPWMIMHVLGFCFSCLLFVYGFFGSLIFNAPMGEFIGFIVTSIVVIVLQIAIFYFMYTLYRYIRKQNNNRTSPVIGSLQVSYQAPQPCYYTAVSNKS